MNSDGIHLMKAILDRPADDLVRLVYADWLDEQGRSNQASFIRLQIEASKFKSGSWKYRKLNEQCYNLYNPCWFPGLQQSSLKAVYCDNKEHIILCAFRRGFPYRLVSTSSMWERHQYLLDFYPIQKWRLSDKNPRGLSERMWCWYRASGSNAEYDLSPTLFDRLSKIYMTNCEGNRIDFTYKFDAYAALQQAATMRNHHDI